MYTIGLDIHPIDMHVYFGMSISLAIFSAKMSIKTTSLGACRSFKLNWLNILIFCSFSLFYFFCLICRSFLFHQQQILDEKILNMPLWMSIGPTFLHMMLRWAKGTTKPNTDYWWAKLLDWSNWVAINNVPPFAIPILV